MDLTFIRKNAYLLLFILIIVSIPSAFAYNYIQNDPRFCTTCHLMNKAVSTWNSSAMHSLNCKVCHEADIITDVNHLVSVVVYGKSVVDQPVVIDNKICEDCHISNDPKWLQVENTAGHKVHIFDSTQSANCIDCHGARLHDFLPPQEICVKCHTADKQIAEQTMGTHCTTCHEFLATNSTLIPEKHTCLSCHPEKNTMGVSFPANAHSDVNCTTCHDPHIKSVFLNCTSCHSPSSLKGLHSTPAHNNCISCHVPHDTNTLRDNCVSCHTDKTSHNSPIDCANCHSFTG